MGRRNPKMHSVTMGTDHPRSMGSRELRMEMGMTVSIDQQQP